MLATGHADGSVCVVETEAVAADAGGLVPPAVALLRAAEGPAAAVTAMTWVGDFVVGGELRARSHCRVAPPLLHCIPDSLT